MGIITCVRKPGTFKSSLNNLWQRTYEVQFVVETDHPQVGPMAVRTAIGSTGTYYTNGLDPMDPNYEFDQGSFVQSISVEQDGIEECQWTATVVYGPYDTDQFGNNPTDWKSRVSFGGERTERVIWFDRDGNAVVNSAGDRFGEPITVPDHLQTLTITRNEWVSDFDPEVASAVSDTVNDATWNGYAVGRCLMGIVTTSEPQFDSTTRGYYYTVTYPVSVARSGTTWKKEILDQGFNALTGPYGSSRVVMVDENGQPYSDPQALDGAGAKLAANGTPVSLPFDVYDQSDWSVLNIDLSLRLGA